jgi:putative SOS response-associated peptidase YedK
MCGRYSVLTEDEIIEIREVIREWSLRIVKDDFTEYDRPPGEIRPTNSAPVILGQGSGDVSFENLRWGFRKYGGKGVIINARSETLTEKGIFNSCLQMGRCVVPAGEYYEWESLQKTKRKHFVKDRDGNILFMAGLYRHAPDIPEGREFVIITKDAYGEVESIHDRMPVILTASQIEPWLSGKLTPEEISSMNFNVTVTPCDDEAACADDASRNDAEQLTLL